jgi:hypothetical protein
MDLVSSVNQGTYEHMAGPVGHYIHLLHITDEYSYIP